MMSQPTPTPTPHRQTHGAGGGGNEGEDSKKLPLIVDIAIDNEGKQMYQVHEYSKLVRKEMPRSTNFARTQAAIPPNYHQSYHEDYIKNEERTPVRKVLGTISPSTLNQKKIADDEEELQEPESATRKTSSAILSMPEEVNGSSSMQSQPFVPSQPAFADSDSNLPQHNHQSQRLAHPNPINVFNTDVKYNTDSAPSSATSTVSAASFSRAQDNDVWCEAVEQAFEEVLNIIPKNGLNKIKISGRSCGRNELISDYIYTKTGKFRSRKQVSSHIQVIKNLGQKEHIIKLINDGPTFESEEDMQQKIKRFEEIFSKINLNKSMGAFNDSMGIPPSSDSGIVFGKRKNSSGFQSSIKRPKSRSQRSFSGRSQLGPAPVQHPQIKFDNFFMSISDQCSSNPIILTIQGQEPPKSLEIVQSANITSRFPGLLDFHDCRHIQIIHNMVKILVPELSYNYSIENGFKSNILLNSTNKSIADPLNLQDTNSPTLKTSSVHNDTKDDVYSSFTCIYSAGKEVLKFNEHGIKLNENRNFLVKFWKFFLAKLVGKDENEVNLAFKNMTIKQVLYSSKSANPIIAASSVPIGTSTSSNEPELVNDEAHQSVVSKSNIKLVLLWEFAKVDDLKDAITTSSNLILPNSKIVTTNENIIPQVVEYASYQHPNHQAYPQQYAQRHLAHPMHAHGVSDISTMTASPSSAVSPTFPLNFNSMMSQSTTTSSVVAEKPGHSSMESWEKPQLDVQRKFQSLQQSQQVQASPQGQRFQQFHPQSAALYPPQQYAQYPLMSPNPPMMVPPSQPAPQMNSSQPYSIVQQNVAPSMDFMMVPAESQEYQMGTLLYQGGFTDEFE